MTDDIKSKIASLLANSDPSQIESLMKLKNSGLASNLSDEQKNALLSAFLKTDTETLKKKLQNLDMSKLSGIDLKNISDKMR